MQPVIDYLTTAMVLPRWAFLGLIAAITLLVALNLTRLIHELLTEHWSGLCWLGTSIRDGVSAAYGRLLNALCAPVTTDRWVIGLLLGMVFASSVAGSVSTVYAQRVGEPGATCETIWNEDLQATIRTCIIHGNAKHR